MLGVRAASLCFSRLTLRPSTSSCYYLSTTPAWSKKKEAKKETEELLLMPMRKKLNSSAKVRRERSIKRLEILTNSKKASPNRAFDITNNVTVKDLAKILSLKEDDVFELILMQKDTDYIRFYTQPINNAKVLHGLAKTLNVSFNIVSNKKKVDKPDEDLDIKVVPPRPEDLKPRPPVVAIMGHIDHGKTTLLDYLRRSRIVEGEHGGITQHIGAFSVKLGEGKVTFVDTPGHAAFKAMRSRGASATDIVVLVVDASEGVLDQTRESIRMIREAKTPMIVALNKIDRPNANVEETKRQLVEEGVMLEGHGGDVQAVAVSALKGTNVDGLVEALVAQAELLQLTADHKGLVEGTVLESAVEKGLGKTATVLIQRGRLKKGDIVVCGQCMAKVKRLENDTGAAVNQAEPSQAIKVIGWRELPSAGEAVNQVENEKRANEVIKFRAKQEQKKTDEVIYEQIAKKRELENKVYKERRLQILRAGRLKMNYGEAGREQESQEDTGPAKVSFVVKTDVDGSLEAIMNALDTFHEEDIALDILDVGVGEVTENDLLLAKQFGGFVYAFNIKVNEDKRKKAEASNVNIKEFNIIYKLMDDLREEVSEKLPLLAVDDVVGRAHVQEEFLINKKIPVAGCKVQQGTLEKANRIRVMRGEECLHEGEIESLKHLKDEVKEIMQGKECGIMLRDRTVRFQKGDVLVSYFVRYEKQETSWTPGF